MLHCDIFYRTNSCQLLPNLNWSVIIEKKGNMSKSNKILTPEYLDWHAKLTGLPSVLTDRIRSSLYKKYKKETSLEAMLLQEKTEYSSFEPMREGGPENKVSYLSFSKQCEEKGPITFEAKPDSELIIKSILKHFPYLKFRNSFRGTDNYNFASPQPWTYLWWKTWELWITWRMV